MVSTRRVLEKFNSRAVEVVLVVRGCCHHEESIGESSASGEARQHIGHQCVHVSSHKSIDLGICVPEYELVARGSARDATRRKAAKFPAAIHKSTQSGVPDCDNRMVRNRADT